MAYTVGIANSKQQREAERKRVGTIVLAALFFILSPVSIWFIHRDKGWDKFDQKQWEVGGSALTESESGSRKRMVDDLMRNYLKPGITRRQVRELLGTPDFVESNPMYEYQVARNAGFRIAFDRSGHFTTAALVHY